MSCTIYFVCNKDLGYHEEVLLRTTFMDVLTSVFKKVSLMYINANGILLYYDISMPRE